MSKKLILILFFTLAFLSLSRTSEAAEYYFKFQLDDPARLGKISRIISIDNVRDGVVYAYANDEELANFEALGYAYTILPHPGKLIVPEMSSTVREAREWDSYPTYDAYVSMMYQFEADYPDLCEIIDIGGTVEGRRLLYARISDNIPIEEDEPEVMFTSSIHGDEITGYVLMLRLIDSLLTSYGTDSLITRLIDSCEIWINPLANPDGTYAGGNSTVYGATRYNANYVDLNRNFPDPEDGQHPDGHSWQPETVDMMNIATAQSFIIGSNFHGGAEVINYPWDTWYRRHADDAWYIDISREYADSAQYFSPSGYLTDLNNGITNGYDWYTISGGRQDYMNFWRGCREVTAEISGTKLPPASQLPAFWTYNRVSFLNWLENGLYGIRGIVTDASSGLPIAATIKVLNHDKDNSFVYTDPEVGDYHRMIEAGVWDLEFSATGYLADTVTGIAVGDHATEWIDVGLEPVPDEPLIGFSSHSAGLVDPGDPVSMNITLVNSGGGDATGVTGTLFTDDSYITITQALSAYPTISRLGGTAVSSSQYQFAVSGGCPYNYPVTFGLEVNADGGYIDTVTFVILIGPSIEDFETGDFTAYEWNFSGNAPWMIVTSPVYEGSYAARSGNISDDQSSSMSLQVNVIDDGEISFHYRVSSESGYDYLQFFIDDQLQDAWSGSTSWMEVAFPVSAGEHTLRWTYDKDYYASSGSDCGWIDKIIFPRIASQLIILTATLPDWTEGVVFSQQLEAAGGVGDLSWADLNGGLEGTGLELSTDGVVSGTPVLAGLISFRARVTDEATGQDDRIISFDINPAVSITTDSLPAGIVGQAYSQQLIAEGGTGAISWSDKNGDLEGTGLVLDTEGLISGNPGSSMEISFTARAVDEVDGVDEKLFNLSINPEWICGDLNDDMNINILDILFLINYKYKEGPAPEPMESADVNSDGDVNLLDILHLINYKYKEGPAPECP